MAKLLFLTFYYSPDLCAGSFRNTSLLNELANNIGENDSITVITTMPNRYSSYQQRALEIENIGKVTIYRIEIPTHRSGFLDQIKSYIFYFFYSFVKVKSQKFDLVYASSSRFFTAFLGYLFSVKSKAILYLDIRDLFVDTMKEVLKPSIFKPTLLFILTALEKVVFKRANHINLISEGFLPYFHRYSKANYSFFSNGIDDEFLKLPDSAPDKKDKLLITYAGNIGEGQGLHKIIPRLAKAIENKYDFLVIGDGGAKYKLVEELQKNNANNVKIEDPVNREQLIRKYLLSDILFIHLNDYEAFKKVLPSKIFELASFDKPILAGVGGFAKEFLEKNVANCLLFEPCNVEGAIKQLDNYLYRLERRTDFKNKFSRKIINEEMASSIIGYLENIGKNNNVYC